MPNPILLIGASVRAAAQLALRGGFAPWCVDLFADRDLQAMAPVRRVRRYPAGLVAALADAPHAPLVYTGALENYPRLIDALARRRPLWGNRGEVLRAVRDPVRLADALRRHGLCAPDVACSSTEIPRDGTWLCKPLRSGGGWHILAWGETDGHDAPRLLPSGAIGVRGRGGLYFQRRIAGFSCAALYVAAGGDSRLLGVTQQLTGADWPGGAPFGYAGSIGPLRLSPQQESTFRQIGACLAAQFQLVGLFGVDVIVSPTGTGEAGIWPVEVNPRYPASAEVLECVGGFSAIELHAAACAHGRLPSEPLTPGGRTAGKAILFAAADLQVPAGLLPWADEQNHGGNWPAVADIPQVGSSIRRGAPVLTVLAVGTDAQQVETRLRRQLVAAEQVLVHQR